MTIRQKEKIRECCPLLCDARQAAVGLPKLMRLLVPPLTSAPSKQKDATSLVLPTGRGKTALCPVPTFWREMKNHGNSLNLSSVVRAIPLVTERRDEPAGVRLRAVQGAEIF